VFRFRFLSVGLHILRARIGIIFIVAASALLFLGQSMALGKDYVLMSEMEGQLVLPDGAPAAQIRLERHWKWAWKKSEGTDITSTDAQGRFRFGAVIGHSRSAGILPHEPTVLQEITAFGPGGSSLIWSAQKRNYDPEGELGRPLRVRCVLGAEEGSGPLFWSTCTLMD
tara:strand:+ start:135 stop:641 length:507 start_codon:yes stop_codon:yes gene_type:complete